VRKGHRLYAVQKLSHVFARNLSCSYGFKLWHFTLLFEQKFQHSFPEIFIAPMVDKEDGSPWHRARAHTQRYSDARRDAHRQLVYRASVV